MAEWHIKPEYYMVAMILSFIIAVISFSGLFLKDDLVGRLIFGFVWMLVGIGWLGQYFQRKNKEE